VFHIPASIACVCLLITYVELLDTWSYMLSDIPYQLPSLEFCLLTTYSESVVRSSCWFIQGFWLGLLTMDVFLNSNWEEVRSSAVNFDTL